MRGARGRLVGYDQERRGRMAVLALLSLVSAVWLLHPCAAGAADRAPTVATAATLTVLGGKVERVGAFSRAPAASGEDLSTGDRVVTAADGRALITFLDGSTVVVEPGSDVSVSDLDVGRPERSRVRLLITAGTVWARIARWLGGRASVTLESNAYAATAHDGLIGAQSRSDGGFVCWTRAGTVSLAAAGGQALAVVQPGQKVTVAPGDRPLTDRFAVNQSTIEIAASGPVLPLVVMPDETRVAGFVAPGIEVNQVFGSLTALRDGVKTVEVPAGAPGRYVVALAAVGNGPYRVGIVGRHQQTTVYTGEWSGQATAGERLSGEISQDVAAGAIAAATARVTGGRLGPLRPADPGAVHGTVLLSPLELSSVPGR
jgi:hypothetical protein